MGQKIFPTPYLTDYDNFKKNGHLRIDADARHDLLLINHNNKIIEIFEDLYKDKKCVIHTHKGSIIIYIISNNNYDKYDYYFWNTTQPFRYNTYENDNFPYFAILYYGYIGTVALIKDIILRINNNDWSSYKCNMENIEFRNNVIIPKIIQKSNKNNKQLKLSDFGLVKCKSK